MATAITTNGRATNQLMRLSTAEHVAPTGYDYNVFVTKVQDYCVSKEIHVPRWRGATPEDRMAFHANVLRAMKNLGLQVAEEHRQDVASEVAQRIIGMGVLQPYLEMEGIEEIIVRDGFVQLERNGQIHDEGYMAPDQYFYQLSRRIADLEGKELGAEDPQIKLGLPDGSRLTAAIPPLSVRGTSINIRRFSLRKLTFDDLIEAGACDRETVDFLTEVAESMRVSVLFAGRPGAGKTTWLNAFSSHLPTTCQASCVETFQELQLGVERPLHMVVSEGTSGMADAINTIVLRMRPDVLVIGEIVSTEALEYILALNLGIIAHSTTHAHSARLAMTRLESLSERSGIPLNERRDIIGSGLGLVVYLAKRYDPVTNRYRRHMQEMMAVLGAENGQYHTKVLKRWTGSGFTPLEGVSEFWRKM
ncbi:MAG: CpaF family protein [Anaerolineae bacterium]|nr:CpaF family protein [Anaerolineae bacterium]